jgi:hypothetical protein
MPSPRLYWNNGTYLSVHHIFDYVILYLNKTFWWGGFKQRQFENLGQTKVYLNDYIFVQVHVELVNCMEA